MSSDFIKCIYNLQEQDNYEQKEKYDEQENDDQQITKKNQMCDMCNISLVSEEELLEHIYNTHDFHLKNEVSLCTLCKSCNDNDSNFHDHIKHSKAQPSTEKNQLLENIKEEMHPCMKCDITFNLTEGRDHILNNHSEHLKDFDVNQFGLKCRFCNKHSWTNHDLNAHENEQHLLGNENQFLVCYMCRTAFNNQGSLTAHKNPSCNENFQNIIYHCLTCNLTYPDSSKLKLHLLKDHPKSINVPCPFCGKLYAKKKYVLQHIKKMHLTGNAEVEECFNCTLCGKTFESRRSLKLHKNKSHGRGFKCVICGKKFPSFEER